MCKAAHWTMFRAQRCDRKKLIRARWRDLCDICKKRLPPGYWKMRHMQIHRKEIEITGRKYHCTNCNKRFKEIANYIRHCAFHSVLRSQQSKEHAIDKCVVDDEAHLDDTQNVQIVTTPSKNDCMKQFGENGTSVCLSPQGTELTEKPIAQLFHGKRDHYKCEYCGRTYMIKLYFDMHVKKHEGFENFKCDVCQKSYTEVHKLNVHKRTYHKAGFLCSNCGQRFPTKDSLLEHRDAERLSMRTCNVCRKVFTTVKSLHVHERIHSGERPFKCSLCGSAFTQRYHLLDHERTHSGATPFACNYCDLSFTTHSSRRRHEKNIHKIGLSTQTHSCDICEATFARKDMLNRHLRQHEKVSSKWFKSHKLVDVSGNPEKTRKGGSNDVVSKELENVERKSTKLESENFERESSEQNGSGSVACLRSDGSNIDDSSRLSSSVRMNCDVRALKESSGGINLEVGSCSVKEKSTCALCVKEFSSQSSLNRHIKNVHKYGGKGSICEICNACYISRKTLQRHLLQAHNIKTVQEVFQSIMCEECGALVQTANGLDIHKVKCH